MMQEPDKRQIRGLAIASLGSTIKRINKLHYRVKSQTDDTKWYNVVKEYGHNLGGHLDGKWICICPDFIYRHVNCKHIFAVLFSKQLRKKIVGARDIIEPVINTSCPKCQSESFVKDGIRHTKHGTDIQRYTCKLCKYRFIVNSGFEHARADPKAVTAALDLYFKGVSFRKVVDHLKQFYNIQVTHVAIIKWLRKFVQVVKPFVDQLIPPHLSGVLHVDEMMIHTKREQMEKGHYQWLWNLMDNTTRFWISSMVSSRREIADARAVFKDAKNKTPNPKAVIHDGLWSYDEAYQKEFYTMKNPRVQNIRSISVRNQGLNSKVERLNSTVREREKVMRGMQKKETAQQIIDALRIYYNFCREHSKLKETPAENAGIRLGLQGNRTEKLIKLATMRNPLNNYESK